MRKNQDCFLTDKSTSVKTSSIKGVFHRFGFVNL